MNALQETLNQAVKDIPTIFLENVVSKKLRKQGINAPKALYKKLARHILSGTTESFKGNIDLTFDQTDADEIERAFARFENEQLPKILPRIAERLSKSVLKDLKSRWPDEYAQQEADLAVFRHRLEERWGKPLGQLRMLLTMSREWCELAHNRNEFGKRQMISSVTFWKMVLPTVQWLAGEGLMRSQL